MSMQYFSLADSALVDKRTKETTCYVDIKSELLRNILKDILKSVRSISLDESKPSVGNVVCYIQANHSLSSRSIRASCTQCFLNSSSAKAGMNLLLAVDRE